MTTRDAVERALRAAKTATFAPGQFVGQEGFMTADGILALADAAGIGSGSRVLDACCGTGGPGRMLVRRRRCSVHGVDADPDAVALARRRAAGLACTYAVASVPPLPPGSWDVVLLVETMLAFADKPALLRAVSAVLPPGGRFACTVEEGMPLTAAERVAMPRADTVWPVTEAALRRMLADAGLVVRRVDDVTARHAAVVRALAHALQSRHAAIAAAVGAGVVDELIASHRLWGRWMASGRVRKLAVVAVRAG